MNLINPSFPAASPFFQERCQTVSLSEKAKLAEPEWQLLLREPGLEFLCPCGLRVEPYLDAEKRGHNVRARWAERDLHLDTCPVVHGEFALRAIEEGNVYYCDGMFLPPAPQSMTGIPKPRAAARQDQGWQGDLTHLVNQAFTAGSLSALEAANRRRREQGLALRNPDYDQMSREVAGYLNSPQMMDNASPAEAARRVGAEIVWGVCVENLVHQMHAMRYNPGVVVIQLRDSWTPEGKALAPRTFRVPYSVGAAVRGKVWEYNRIIPGPYLVFLSVGANDVVHQLTIMPIVAHGSGMACLSKESGAEGRFVGRLRRFESSVGFIKLSVMADLSVLGSVWRHRLDRAGGLPCRPDLIALGQRGTAIYQLEGSVDVYYRHTVRRSLAKLREFFNDPKILIRGITLRELDSGDPLFMEEVAALV